MDGPGKHSTRQSGDLAKEAAPVVKHAAKGAASKAGGLASKVVKTVAERARRGKHATEGEGGEAGGGDSRRTGGGINTSPTAAGTSFVDSTLTDSVRTRLRALACADRVRSLLRVPGLRSRI